MILFPDMYAHGEICIRKHRLALPLSLLTFCHMPKLMHVMHSLSATIYFMYRFFRLTISLFSSSLHLFWILFWQVLLGVNQRGKNQTLILQEALVSHT